MFLQKVLRNFIFLLLISLTFVLGQAGNMVVENSVGVFFKKRKRHLLYSDMYFFVIVIIVFLLTYFVSGDIDNVVTIVK